MKTQSDRLLTVIVTAGLLSGATGLGLAQTGQPPQTSPSPATTTPALSPSGAGGQPPLASKKAPQAAENDFVRCDGCFAFVQADGTLLRRKPFDGVTSSPFGNGAFEVRFPLRIEGCAWLGTIGNAAFSGSTAGSMIAVTGRSGTDDGLFIQTWNAAGTPTDLPFSVRIHC
jgi:hypothetical protein